jgi:hypothetical protein
MIPVGPRTLRAFISEIAGKPVYQRCYPFLARPNQTINFTAALSTGDEQHLEARRIPLSTTVPSLRLPSALICAAAFFIALPDCVKKAAHKEEAFHLCYLSWMAVRTKP